MLNFFLFESLLFLISTLWAIREQRHMEATMSKWEIEKYETGFIFNP